MTAPELDTCKSVNVELGLSLVCGKKSSESKSSVDKGSFVTGTKGLESLAKA